MPPNEHKSKAIWCTAMLAVASAEIVAAAPGANENCYINADPTKKMMNQQEKWLYCFPAGWKFRCWGDNYHFL
jgi:hypothetical protein